MTIVESHSKAESATRRFKWETENSLIDFIQGKLKKMSLHITHMVCRCVCFETKSILELQNGCKSHVWHNCTFWNEINFIYNINIHKCMYNARTIELFTGFWDFFDVFFTSHYNERSIWNCIWLNSWKCGKSMMIMLFVCRLWALLIGEGFLAFVSFERNTENCNG